MNRPLHAPWLLLLASCGARDAMAPSSPEPLTTVDQEVEEKPMDAPASAAAPARQAAKMKSADGAEGGGMDDATLAVGGAPGFFGESPPPPPEEDKRKGNAAPAEAGAVRAWFPESFLWQPLVETGGSGSATVQFTVPDTLTTWRILALGQTARGSQGGTTHTFLSTLPAYVDVAAPLELRVGDAVDMPVQVVNQGADALRGSLSVSVTGGLGQGGSGVNIAPWGSSASTVRTVANHAGQLVIRAGLTSGAGEPIDTVQKVVTVSPVGRPIEQSRAGTLAGPRTVTFDPVGNALDGSVAITVFPGALSVLRQELDLAGGRGGDLGSAAYAWRVSQSAAPLVASAEVAPATVRDLSLVALQRLVRGTRSAGSDPATTMDAALALAGLGHTEGDTLETRLAGRLRDVVAQQQQPDGLWTLGAGYGLDDQLVASARCLWALRQADTGAAGAESTVVKGARLRFSGALERFGDRLSDPYVAAWAITSGGAGALDGELQAKLRKVVQDALVKNADGSLRLDPTLGANSARVLRTSTAEATAVALLALSGDSAEDVTRRADLATGALGRWSPGAGFGGGWGGLTALTALATAMGGEIPDSVTITLYADDAPVGQGALDPKQKHAPVRLAVPGAAHTLRVEASPAVPGLAFTAVSTSWVPWVQPEARGLELRVTPPARPLLGRKDTLRVEIAGPTGASADVDIDLPAGVDLADVLALNAALSATSGTATTEEGAVHLRGLTLVNGAWSADLPVTPTLGGSLQSGAAVVTLSDGETFTSLPSTWVVGR